MMRAGKALMFSRGYLPTTKSSHKTIIEFMQSALGDECQDLLLRFNRMRRKRHDFIYDSENHTTVSEAQSALRTGRELIAKINARIAEENPGSLF